jgi:hypothetical protein
MLLMPIRSSSIIYNFHSGLYVCGFISVFPLAWTDRA